MQFPGVAVLTYHSIRRDDWPEGAVAFENLHVRAFTFEAHCRVIRETCTPLSLDDWRAALAGGPPLPPRPVLITFDDGYRTMLTVAAPLLAAYELPAVLFACSDPITQRTRLWYDAIALRDGEAAVEALKGGDYESWLAACGSAPAASLADEDPSALLRPDDLKTLVTHYRVEVGGHTRRHPILSRVPASVQREEIAGNRDALERWTDRPVRAFAYPNGRPGIDYTSETVETVHDLGFDFAFTTRSAFATPEEPALERSRFLIVSELTAADLAHRLTYAWAR